MRSREQSKPAAEALSDAVLINGGKGLLRYGNFNLKAFSAAYFYSLEAPKTEIGNRVTAVILYVQLNDLLDLSFAPVFDGNNGFFILVMYFRTDDLRIRKTVV